MQRNRNVQSVLEIKPAAEAHKLFEDIKKNLASNSFGNVMNAAPMTSGMESKSGSKMRSLTIWVRDLLMSIGMYDKKPVKIYEDNKVSINVVSDGASTTERTRYVHIRNNFIGQFIESNEIKVIYCST